ncbi:hypothetical protein [Flavobacterium pedocola]
MKILLLLFLTSLLIACTSKTANKTVDAVPVNKTVSKEKTQKQTAVIRTDTLRINNQKYLQTIEDDHFISLVSLKGDTIVKAEDYYSEAEILDINEDGFQDIRVFFFMGKIPNACDNYLFDSKQKTFKIIEDCWLDVRKIKGTNFYYSYNRAGCADMNWESNLSKIENNKLVDYGYISGQGCDEAIKENPQVIKIYKVVNSDKEEMTLVKTLPYLKHIPTFEDKWDFIEKYWTKNFKKFN